MNVRVTSRGLGRSPASGDAGHVAVLAFVPDSSPDRARAVTSPAHRRSWMEPTPESLAALLAVIAGSAIAVAIVTVRLLRSGRTVPPPWGGPPARRRR